MLLEALLLASREARRASRSAADADEGAEARRVEDEPSLEDDRW